MKVLLAVVTLAFVACFEDLVNMALLVPEHKYEVSTVIGPSIKQAFLDAVAEVNADQTVRVRLNPFVYNTHSYTDETYIANIMASMRKKNIHAIVGAMNSTVTEAYLQYMATNDFKIPMVSYSSKIDGWEETYDNFKRVIPSNSQLAEAVTLACQGLKWEEVALMHLNDEEGFDFADKLQSTMHEKDIDVINFRQAVSHGNGTLESVIKSVEVNCAKIIVIYAPTEETIMFVKEAARRGFAGEDYNYILVSYDNTLVSSINAMSESDREDIMEALQGSVYIGVRTNDNINPSIENYVRDAVYTNAKAAEKVIFSLQNIKDVGIFMSNMQEVEFEGKTGFVEFENSGYNRLINHYHVWNWMTPNVMEPILLVGFGQATTIHPTPVWAGGQREGWDDIPDSDSCADDSNFDLWWVFLIIGVFVLLLVILCTYSRYSKGGREVAADPNIYGTMGDGGDSTKRTARPAEQSKGGPGKELEEEKVPQSQQQPVPIEKHQIPEDNIPQAATAQDPAISDEKPVEQQEVPAPQQAEEQKESEAPAAEEAKQEEPAKVEDEAEDAEKPGEEDKEEANDNEDKQGEEGVDVGDVGDVEQEVAAEEAKAKEEAAT